MAELVLDCPHCGAERTGFVFGGEYLVKRHKSPRSGAVKSTWNTLFVCRRCTEGVVAQLETFRDTPPSAHDVVLTTAEFQLMKVRPKPQPVAVPEHLPELIARDYKEAADSLRRQKFTSADMMFRKVLQRATTALATTAEPKITVQGLKLHARIDTLAYHQLITPAMREWAHLIRLDGNEANHEEDVVFEQSDAEQIQAFTELFLIYAFTLPERVKLARGTSTNTDQSA